MNFRSNTDRTLGFEMGESFDTDLHVAFASEFLPISSNISMNSYRGAQNSIILE